MFGHLLYYYCYVYRTVICLAEELSSRFSLFFQVLKNETGLLTSVVCQYFPILPYE